MEKILAIMNANRSGFLATVDGDQARVRPFEFQFEKDGTLYFCTANTKDVYRQMKDKPGVEWSVMTKEMQWVRVSGNAEFVSDASLKKEVITRNKLIESIYKSADNPIFEVFAIRHGKASYSDFSGSPTEKVTW